MMLLFPRFRFAISHFSRQRFLLAAIVLALSAVAAGSIDVAAARTLREVRLAGDLERLVRLAEVFAWGGSVALIALIAGLIDSRGWRIGLLLAAASLGSGVAADSLKLVIARTRPAAAQLERVTAGQTFVGWLPAIRGGAKLARYGHAQQSFPSGHAATAAGLAVGLAALYPRGRWMFASFAVLACFQRLAAQAHFPSDVLAGAAIGCLVGGGVMHWRRGDITLAQRAPGSP